MNQDLTVGTPSRVLWRFCLPLFGSIVFQQLYNIADSLVAGRFVGENALASVGNSYEITLIFLAFAFGCNIGCSVIVSQLFGAKEYREMKTAVSTAAIGSGVICVVLMALGLLLGRQLLELIQTPEELMADSLIYLNIYLYGLPFLFFYNLATGVFSALGDSKTPFYFLAASSTANIAVDILFVTAFQMGVAGVAWATFLCQGISCVLAVVVVLLRLRRIETIGRAAAFSFPMLCRIARIAVPSILQQTLANGVSNFAAQNLGAWKLERIHAGFRAGLKMVWLLCIPLVGLYFFAGKWMLLLFLENPSQAAMDTGLTFLRILSPFYFVVSAKLVADGILRGIGSMLRFMIATFTDLLLRVVLASVLSLTVLGATGIWCAWPIGWTVATVLSLVFYKTTNLEKQLSPT